jgi:hypothetical protein
LEVRKHSKRDRLGDSESSSGLFSNKKSSPKSSPEPKNPLSRGVSLEDDLAFGVAESVGKRPNMEDRFLVVPFKPPLKK